MPPPLTVKNTFIEFGPGDASPADSRVRSYTDSAVPPQGNAGFAMDPLRGAKVLELQKLDEELQDGLSDLSTEEARPRLMTGGSLGDSADTRQRLDTGGSDGRTRLDTCASLDNRSRLDTGDFDGLNGMDMPDWQSGMHPVKVDPQMMGPPGQLMPPQMMPPYATPWLWGPPGYGMPEGGMWPMPGPYDGCVPNWPGPYGMEGMPGPQGLHVPWTSQAAAKPKAKQRARTKSGDSEGKGSQTSVPRTTAMVRNLPPEYTNQMLLDLLNGEGFLGTYTFVYLPIDFRTGNSFGYGFIDFVTPAAVENFRQHFDGFTKWAVTSDRICEVCWSEPLQGLEGHIERYRNSPMMHDSVSDMFKPMMFKDGVRVSFPAPTKKLKPPRMRHARGDNKDGGEDMQ